MTRSKQSILDELAQEEARLAQLERAAAEARERLERLRSELSATPTTQAPLLRQTAADRPAPRTAAEKVRLFRSLFRGRQDIFPTRFVSKKTGKPGYAPACSNKWEVGLCALKTGGRCSDCANQAFVPVGDDVIADHLRGRHVMGVRFTEAADEEEAAAPWMRLPSGQTSMKPITAPLPPVVKAVLSQRLFVEKAGLPAQLLNQLKRLAAFQNPEFYKKQKMRLSTALTPRVIACAEDLAQFVALPRGCASAIQQLLADHGVKLTLEDQRHGGEAQTFKFDGELTAIQKDAARTILAHDSGVFVGPPGIGKTVLGTYLVAERGCSTLILVHRKPLLDQWVAQLAMFLGIEEKEIGQIGGGKRKPNGRLDVAMIQSLVRKDEVADLVADYGHVIVDECHHLPALSFERVLSAVRARYVLGLTATPQRRDGHQPITEMQLGPVRFKVDAKSQAAQRRFDHKLIVRETDFRMSNADVARGFQAIYGALANDKTRNERIVDDVVAAIREGRSPILLTERKDVTDRSAAP